MASALDLLPHHRALITASAITDEVALARGYRTLTTKADAERLGFAAAQRNVPGLLVPVWNVAGDLATYQLRPDQPRIKDGKPLKYETPAGSRMVLDVPRSIRDAVGNPAAPLWITEGARKADAAASRGLCCIALLGVWNWRGTNDAGGATALPDWESVALKDRDVFIVFDSDVMTKQAVAGAMKRLMAFLDHRGARGRVVYLEPASNGAKVGLDDYFAAGGDLGGLLARAEDRLRSLPHDEADDHAPYVATPAGIVYRKPTKDGPVDDLLANFTAHIVEEVLADDGMTERAELVIAGELGGKPLPAVRVPARRFAGLDWVTSEWGARPIISAGMGTRDRIREAIQRLSPDIARRHVFEHPGWRHVPEHGWCYLHADGAIGASGAIAGLDVSLQGAAGRIRLPVPPRGDDLRAALRACLDVREVAPDAITVPLFGAVYRAGLCELIPADTGIFMAGPTGVFKTELSALAMQHVGAEFDRLHLPAQWVGTANFLERVAFEFKDAPLVIDDFAPAGSTVDIARLHATADRVYRGIGNRGGRGRMQADGTLRPDLPPRGIVIGTGEDVPRGQSLRSRLMVLELSRGEVRRDRLTTAQAAGRAGLFAAAFAGFVHWIAPQFDSLRARLPEILADFRSHAQDAAAHARTPDAVAHLAVGWWVFITYTVEAGVLTDREGVEALDRSWSALGDAAARQAGHQASEEPARRFLDLLASAIAGGYAHLASTSGGRPTQPEAWGWRRVIVGAGDYTREEWREQGGRAGWLDGENVYIDLEAALTAAQRVGQATGGVAVGSKTLAKRLHERGWLVTTAQEHGELQVRHSLEGRRRRVLHLSTAALMAEESGQSGQSGQPVAEPASRRAARGSDGRIVWPGFRREPPQSGHKTRPEPAPSCANGRIGRNGRVPETPPGFDAEVARVLANLKTISAVEIEEFRAECAAASDDDPNIAVDREALTRLDTQRLMEAAS